MKVFYTLAVQYLASVMGTSNEIFQLSLFTFFTPFLVYRLDFAFFSEAASTEACFIPFIAVIISLGTTHDFTSVSTFSPHHYVFLQWSR